MLARIWQGRLGGLRLIMILAVVTLVMIGLGCIHAQGKTFFYKQLIWIALSIAGFIAINMVHYRWLGQISHILFIITLLLLVVVLVGKYMGLVSLVPTIGGSSRWLNVIPYVRIQPSELTKLTYILALAWYLRHRKNYRFFSGLIGPFALTVLPMVLILLEPDLGTVLLFLPVLFCVLFTAGARIKHLLAVIGIGILLSPLFYFIMEDYQRDRVRILLKQDSQDAFMLRGPGYQLHQSKICIGSGRFSGHGWGKGIYIIHEKFLPARHNDFIFALIAHQWGFLGSVAVLALYGLIILGGIEIAGQQREPFGRLLAVGITTLLAFQMLINMGMTMGLTPVTGLTLPFISYGGSSLLSSFLALGLLVNVARRRPHQIARKSFEFDD